MMKNLKKKKGFTLIELIIVIAILGILAAIAIPKFGNVQENARKKADIASAKTIADTAAMLIASEEIKPATEYGSSLVKTGSNGSIGEKVGNELQSIPSVQASTGSFIVNIESVTGVIKVYVASADTESINDANQIYPKPSKLKHTPSGETEISNPFYK